MNIDKVYETIQNNSIKVIHFGLPNIKAILKQKQVLYISIIKKSKVLTKNLSWLRMSTDIVWLTLHIHRIAL